MSLSFNAIKYYIYIFPGKVVEHRWTTNFVGCRYDACIIVSCGVDFKILFKDIGVERRVPR